MNQENTESLSNIVMASRMPQKSPVSSLNYYQIMREKPASIWNPVNIASTAKLGFNVNVGTFTEIGPGVIVGDYSRLGSSCFLCSGVELERYVFLGPHITFTHDRNFPSGGKGWEKILVKRGARIGGGSIILPGVTIGVEAVIGAGSVVTKSVPDGECWFGNPARKHE